MIEFYRVAKEYQGRRVLRDVTFQAKSSVDPYTMPGLTPPPASHQL